MDYIESTGVQMEAEGAAAEVSTAPATGEQSADAALKHLMEDMKVPRDKAEKYLKAKSRQAAAKPIAQTAASQTTRTDTQPTEAPAQPETDKSEPSPAAPAASPRPSFDELIRDDEYKQAFQQKTEDIVKGRVAKLSGYKEAMETMKPMLLDMATMLGLDVSKPDALDYKAITEAYRNDPENYRKAATDKGIDSEAARSAVQTQVDTEQLRQRVQVLEEEKQLSVQKQVEKEILDRHMRSLRQQEAEIRKSFPNFSLDKELGDPENGKKFRDLTMPGSGLSVMDVYRMLHWKEIEAANKQAAAKLSMDAVAASIASGQQRPRENNPAAGSGTSQYVPLSQRSKAEREEIVRRVKRGEKIHFK